MAQVRTNTNAPANTRAHEFNTLHDMYEFKQHNSPPANCIPKPIETKESYYQYSRVISILVI